MAPSTLSVSSFDKDGHEGAIASSEMCSFDSNILERLRLDIVKLIIEVTSKFQSVRKHVQLDASSATCGTDCENDSICSASSSECTSSESEYSGDTDSTYHDVFEDEPDSSDKMYNGGYQHEDELPNHDSAHPIERTLSPNITEPEHDDTTDFEDDTSVEEMYTDFRKHARAPLLGTEEDNSETDNLICPGDVLEYCTIDGNQTAKRDTVMAIVDGSSDAMVTLKSGVVLRPKLHSVRKVKFYDGVNNELIPNPLAQWQRLDHCILQPGLVDSFKEGSDNDTEAGDEVAMEDSECRARAERRRQNKQRQVSSSSSAVFEFQLQFVIIFSSHRFFVT